MRPAAADRDEAAAVLVIVVSHNTRGHLSACLEAYDRQDHPTLRIVVVDNASVDGSAALLRTLASRPRRHPLGIVTSGVNRGFAGAVNDVLAVSDEPIVVVSNVDVVPHDDLVSRAVASLLAEPRRGSVQPKLLRPDSGSPPIIDTTGHVIDRARLAANRGEGERDVGQFDRPGPVFGVSGAVAIHRRAMLDDVAWRDGADAGQVLTEDLFAFFEDVELDWRARRRGWEIWYEPTACATHERGGHGARRSPFVEELNLANRLLVLVTADDAGDVVRRLPLVTAVAIASYARAMLRSPGSAARGVMRLIRGLPAARRRRRELERRSCVDARDIVDRWMVAFAPSARLRVLRQRHR